MSNQTVISVESLGKAYRINHQLERQRYVALRDVVSNKFRGLFRTGRRRPDKSSSREDFWALKNVDFEVKRGDVLGIVGRNGAGKSTLLKILSRITEPSEGRVRIKGRVASLLEVGTGFHPELTGRENIFLNGAILGMSRAEIKSKFDEIVAFAEVEKFLDTAVKFYSSGMYVRLAFAVAAHLEPEILIVDEVLAVGDAEFQKKCLGKMRDVSNKDGRTVLFVSHNMPAVQRLCDRAVVLVGGKIAYEGSVQDCMNIYGRTDGSHSGGKADLSPKSGIKRRGSGVAQFESAELLGLDNERVSTLGFGQPARIRFVLQASRRLVNVLIGFSFVARDGTELQGTAAHDGGIPETLEKGTYLLECNVSPMLLVPGGYFLRAAIFSRTELYEHLDEFLPFEVAPLSEANHCTVPIHYVGHVYHSYKWSIISQQRSDGSQRNAAHRHDSSDSGSRQAANSCQKLS